jgi:hypothetical protein
MRQGHGGIAARSVGRFSGKIGDITGGFRRLKYM